MRSEIIFADDVTRSENLTVDVCAVLWSVYGRELLTKRQYALAVNGRNRVRKKWRNVFDKQFAKLMRKRIKGAKMTLLHDETYSGNDIYGGSAELAVIKSGGAI